jgi:hypothetical protein
MKTFILAATFAVVAADGIDWTSSYGSMLTTNLATCPPGTWRNPAKTEGQNCFACLPGEFAEGTNQAKCTKCQAGRFSKANKAISRVTCVQCPAGSFWGENVVIGGTNDCRDIGGNVCSCGSENCVDQRVCTTCEAGRYQSKAGSRSCFDCNPGTYREDEGGTSEQSCTRCDMETFDFVKLGPKNDQYVYGATRIFETCKYRPVDCKVTAWGPYSRCNRNCGGGTQKKTRSKISDAQHNGSDEHCQKLEDVRPCNTHQCSDMGDRFPTYAELKNGLWWELKFDAHDYGADLAAGMTAQCRYQKNEATGPNRWELPQTVENVKVSDVNGQRDNQIVNTPVEGFCCRATAADKTPIGKTWCYGGNQENEVNFWDTTYVYSDLNGKMCDPHSSNCATFKPIMVHKRKCKEMTCVVEEHSCTTYQCPQNKDHPTDGLSDSHIPGWCPNKGHPSCAIGSVHTSLRVTHSVNEEQGGHYCLITDKATKTCECFCLDAYQTLSENKEIVVPHFNEDVQTHGKRWTGA